MADGQAKASIDPRTRKAVANFLNAQEFLDQIISAKEAKSCTPEIIMRIATVMVERNLRSELAAQACGVPRQQWQTWKARAQAAKGRRGVFAMLRDAVDRAETAQKCRIDFTMFQMAMGGSPKDMADLNRYMFGEMMPAGELPQSQASNPGTVNLTVNMLGFVQEMRGVQDLDVTIPAYEQMSALWDEDQKALPERK